MECKTIIFQRIFSKIYHGHGHTATTFFGSGHEGDEEQSPVEHRGNLSICLSESTTPMLLLSARFGDIPEYLLNRD